MNNQNNSNFLKIYTKFPIPYILFVLVVLIPVRNTETKWKFFCFCETNKKQWKQIEFSLFQFEPKKMNCFEGTLIESVFWRFFRFVSVFWKKFCLFGCFDTGPKHQNKLEKIFGFRKTNQKIYKTEWVSVCFWFKPKKNWLFRGHPTHNRPFYTPHYSRFSKSPPLYCFLANPTSPMRDISLTSNSLF